MSSMKSNTLGRVAVGAKALTPGSYGERICQCQGILVEIRNGTGWLQPLQSINHPSARWNRGQVYMSLKDLRNPSQALQAGDLMVFHLYADSKGLGAEDAFPSRDPSGEKAAEEGHQEESQPTPDAQPWQPPTTRSWEPWWKREDGDRRPWQKKETWWKREGQDTWPQGTSPARTWSRWSCQGQEDDYYSDEDEQFYEALENFEKAQLEQAISPAKQNSLSERLSTCLGSDEQATSERLSDEATSPAKQNSLSERLSTCLGSDEQATSERLSDEDEDSSEDLMFESVMAHPSALSLFAMTGPPPGLQLTTPVGPPPGLPPPRGVTPLGPESASSKHTLSLVEMLPE